MCEVSAFCHINNKVVAMYQKIDNLSINLVDPKIPNCEIDGVGGYIDFACQM